MIILLYGPNTYKINQKLEHIKSQYHKKHLGLSIKSFHPEKEDSLTDLKNFCLNTSLFETNKLGIIKDLEDWLDKAIKPILKDNTDNQDTTLIITASKKPKSPLAFLLQKPVAFEEFKAPQSKDLYEFIGAESKNKNITLSKEAQDFLIKNQPDINSLSQEIAKLSLLDKSDINLEDIKNLNLDQNFDFFFLFKKLSSNDIGQKLTAYHALKAQHEDEAKIFNILTGSWHIKKAQAAKLDEDIKSGRLEYNEAILKLIIK